MALAVATLQEFGRSHDLEFIALFGSQARGTPTPQSDYDLALMPARWDAPGNRWKSGIELATLLGTGAVDTTWLPHASWLLASRVARDGKALYERRPGTFKRFQSAARLQAADSDVWRRRQRAGIRRFLAKVPVVDIDLVQEKLKQLTEVLRAVMPMLAVSRETYAEDQMRCWATERSLMLLVEYAASINSELSSAAGIPPSDYYSSFFSAAQSGGIDRQVALALAPLASLRNLLVHAYERVEVADVYDRLVASLPTWEAYVEQVLTRLER